MERTFSIFQFFCGSGISAKKPNLFKNSEIIADKLAVKVRLTSWLRNFGGLWLAFSTHVFAADNFQRMIPIHEIFPTPSGIVYPSLLTAAGVNPAALPQKAGKVKALGAAYSPAPGGSGSHLGSISYGVADKTKGLGLGWKTDIDSRMSNGIFIGGGFRSESTSIGIGLRDTDLDNGLNPEVDIGILAGTGTDLTLALAIYRLQASPQIDFGIGFSNDKNYTFELNLLLPPVGTALQAGSEYIVTAATTVYASIFGLSFSSSYSTRTSHVSQSVSVLIKVMKKVNFTIQYRSPNRSYYGIVLTF